MPTKTFIILIAVVLFISGCTSTLNQSRVEVNKIDSPGLDNSVCSYTEGRIVKGRIPGTIIGSTLLTNRGERTNGAIHVRFNGTIGAVGDFDEITKAYNNAALLDCRQNTVLSPGWVNSHEHISYSYEYPNPDLKPIYSHRDEWRLGLNGKKKLPSPKSYSYRDGKDPESKSILIWAELRHLLSGTTSIAGSGGVPGIVKNINIHKYNTDPVIYSSEANMSTFPFSSNAVQDFKPIGGGLSNTIPKLRIDKNLIGIPYVPHVAEGTKLDCTAKIEMKEYLKYLESKQKDGRRFSLIHGVAASGADLEKLSELDITLIWSPRSNLALYGQTIDIKKAKNYGTRIALGSDWSPSGSFNMLQEISCAEKINKFNGSILSDKDLWLMATYHYSYALGEDENTGSLQSGLKADFFLVKKKSNESPYGAAIRAKNDDIVGVWVDGKSIVLSLNLWSN